MIIYILEYFQSENEVYPYINSLWEKTRFPQRNKHQVSKSMKSK